MHFPIIELKPNHVKKDERMSDCELIDDTCINYFTDYYGDEYSEEKRKEYLKSGRLQKLLDGIAKVSTRGYGSITFLDADTIRATINSKMLKIADKIQQKILGGERFSPNDLGYMADYWEDFEEMFHYESCGHTSGNLVSDAVWYAGKTMYIGAIFDAKI